MTRSSVNAPGFGDQISPCRTVVAGRTGPPATRICPTQQATLTTAAADCTGCKAAS